MSISEIWPRGAVWARIPAPSRSRFVLAHVFFLVTSIITNSQKNSETNRTARFFAFLVRALWFSTSTYLLSIYLWARPFKNVHRIAIFDRYVTNSEWNVKFQKCEFSFFEYRDEAGTSHEAKRKSLRYEQSVFSLPGESVRLECWHSKSSIFQFWIEILGFL